MFNISRITHLIRSLSLGLGAVALFLLIVGSASPDIVLAQGGVRSPEEIAAPSTKTGFVDESASPTLVLAPETAPAQAFFAPIGSATKTDALIVDNDTDGVVDPGDTIRYTVEISNTGDADLTNVNLNDTIDANTTLVGGSVLVTPLALDDAYSVFGNVGISVPAGSGLLANDVDPDGILPLTAVSLNTTGTLGAVSMNGDGSFTYSPPAGYTGPDTFAYTAQDNGGLQSIVEGTVTLTISGMIWFIDDNATCPCDGTLANPFDNLAVTANSFDANAVDSAGDIIFIYEGAYTGGLTLLNDQLLIGQGADDTILTITGITLPPHSNILPATNLTDPAITTTAANTAGVIVDQNNELHGFTLGNTTDMGIKNSLMGSVGILKIRDVTKNGTGGAVNIASGGTLDVQFDTITSSGSATKGINLNGVSGAFDVTGNTSITSPGNTGIDIQGSSTAITFAGSSKVVNTGAQTAVNYGTNTGTLNFTGGGLNIDTTSGFGFNATGGGTINITGGTNTIDSTSATALNVSGTTIGTSDITFQSISSSGAANGIVLNGTGSNGGLTVTGNGGVCTPSTSTCTGGFIQNMTGDGISLTNVGGGVSFTNARINNTGRHGVFATGVANFSYVNGYVNLAGDANDEEGFQIINGTGAYAITGTYITNAADDAIEVDFTSTQTMASLDLSNSCLEGIGDFPGAIPCGTPAQVGTYNSTAGNNFAGSGVDINVENNATISSITMNNLDVRNFDGRGISADFGLSTPTGGTITNMSVDNAFIDGVGTFGFAFVGDGSGSGTLQLTDSNILRADNASALVLETNDDAALVAAVARNTFSVVNETFTGVACLIVRNDGNVVSDTPTMRVTMDTNTCTDSGDLAVLLASSRGSNGSLDLRLTNNTFATTPGVFFWGAIIDSGNGTSGESDTVCLEASANNIDDSDGFSNGILLQQFSGTTYQLANYGGVGNNAAAIQSFIDLQNPLSSPGSLVNTGGSLVVNYSPLGVGNFCNTPPVPAAPITPSPLVKGTSTPIARINLPVANSVQSPFASFVGITPTEIRQSQIENQATTFDNQISELSTPGLAPLPFSGETVNQLIGTLPAGKGVRIFFDVTVDNLTNGLAPTISNQGTVSSTELTPILTDDPDVGGSADPTVTVLDSLTLSDQVWVEINGNNVYDNGTDTPVNGVSLSLFIDDGTIPNIFDGSDTFLGSTSTAGGGLFSFASLLPGNYIVRVDAANFAAAAPLDGLVSISGANDPDDDVDNDDNGIDDLAPAANGIVSNAITLSYNTEIVADGTGQLDINDTLDFGFVALADLMVYKSDSTDPIQAGGTLTYTIVVTNAGPASAAGVTVVDTLPPEVSYVSDGCSVGAAPGNVWTWTVGALGLGSTSCDVTVNVISNGSGVITNIVVVSSTTTDPNLADNIWVEPTNTNSPPSLSNIAITNPINENDTVTLTGNISDTDVTDAFTLTVMWGDGSTDTYPYPAGTGSFTETHQYLDDNPTATASDVYTVNLTLEDPQGLTDTDSTSVTVNNVNPSSVALSLSPYPVDENGSVQLVGWFSDVGTQDTFTITIDWGDGVVENLPYPAGTTIFTETHAYLDDNPSGTSFDEPLISVTVTDDDGGAGLGLISPRINNVDPTIASIFVSSASINENDTIDLMGTFTDPGTLDTYTVTIDWGDGSVEDFAYPAGSTAFSETHQYLDDDPTSTASDVYTPTVTVTDDDTGAGSDSTTLTVNNIDPTLSNLTANNVFENGVATLTGNIADVGTLDTFTLTVDWGDGIAQDITYPAGTTAFTETHQYLDDDPSGTPSDLHTVNVTLVDDDTGLDNDSTNLTVTNLDPVLSNLNATDVDENNSTLLTGDLADIGTVDTYTVTVDWGDGNVEDFAYAAGTTAITETHQYLDDDPSGTASDLYTVNVSVVDDDTGADSGSTSLTVTNVAPSLFGLTATDVDENGISTVTGLLTDFGTLDTFTVTIDWGDGNVETFAYPAGTTIISETHQYLDDDPSGTPNDLYTVAVTVEDDDTGSDSGTNVLTVSNVAPVVDAGPDQHAPEGSPTITFTGWFTDVGTLDTFDYLWDFGDGVTETGSTLTDGMISTVHTYPADDGVYTMTLTITDDDTGIGSDTAQVTILNEDPTTDAGPDIKVLDSMPVTFTATINDSSPLDTFTFQWNFGDGITETGSTPSTGVISTTHTYSDFGVYTMEIMVWDDDGGAATDAITVTVNAYSDLTITKDDSEDPAIAGAPQSYTVSVSNAGPSDAYNVVVTDTLPAGVMFDGGAGCIDNGGGEIVCDLGMIPEGVVAAVQINVTPAVWLSGIITNMVWTTSDSIEVNDADNHAEETTEILPYVEVIDEDFDDPPGDEWCQANRTSTTPATGDPFHGEFGNEIACLNLDDLPSHTKVTVEFDLYAIRSWDGNLTELPEDVPPDLEKWLDSVVGPDRWTMQVVQGPGVSGGTQTVIDTNFSNWDNDFFRQAYPGNFGEGDYLHHTGAAQKNTLGYIFFGRLQDSVYHIEVTFDHTGETLDLEWEGIGLQGVEDESWGLDNVRVVLHAGGYKPFRQYLPFIPR